MSRSFDASTQTGDASLVITEPLTLSIWFNPTVANGFFFGITDTAGGNRWFLRIPGSTELTALATGTGGGTPASTSGANITAGNWYHGCGVFTSSTSRAAYVNGNFKGTDTTANTVGSVTNIVLGGAYVAGGIAPNWNGLLADAAVWSVALTDNEVAALAKGVPAYLIRPAALKIYYPLYGLASPEPDFSGNAANSTLAGSPPAGATNPPTTLFTFKSLANSLQPAPAGVLIYNIIGANFTRKISYVGY